MSLVRILAVDTTTPDGSVAVLEDERVLAEMGVRSPSTHSSRLLASIHFLLQSLALDVRDLHGFAVAPGPGSFTGIRIGLSTVKALSFASEKPVAPVSSLLAMSHRLADCGAGRWVAPVLDARKGEVYAALIERGTRMEAVVPEGAYAPDDFLRRVGSRRTVLFGGGGAEIYRGLIEDRMGARARFDARPPFIAAEVGRLGFRVLKDLRGVTAEALEPLYYRVSQAEEKR
jgi:tRNA threonylcarbamoyladenosine biosynthesis protein TsaB